MRTPVILLLFLLITPIRAQEIEIGRTTPQTALTRKVLHTLGDNEVLHHNKYSVIALKEGEKYAFVTKNNSTGIYSLIFNGNCIATTDYFPEEDPFTIKYLNPAVENGYAFTYCKRADKSGEAEYYVNIGGVEDGPYESIIVYTRYGVPDSYPLSVADVSYMYKSTGEWFYNNTEEVKGPYAGGDITNFFRSDDGEKIGFSYTDKDNLHYLNIDNHISGPFVSPYDFTLGSIANIGNFVFCYTVDTFNWWANIDGKNYGPYREVDAASMTANGKFAFSYIELAGRTRDDSARSFFNINGKKYGPHQTVFGVRISGNGNFIYSYGTSDSKITRKDEMLYAYRTNYKTFINTDGKIYGPYSSVQNLYIEDNGYFAFEYIEDNEPYLNINGEVYGPYLRIYKVYISDKGEFLVHYTDSKGSHISYNGDTYILDPDNPDLKRVWEFAANNGYKIEYSYNNDEYINENFKTRGFYYINEDNEISIISNDRTHRFISNNRSDYVKIDNKRIDAARALTAWFDKDRNSFLWNSIEGKELVLHEYKLR